jgi:hypothetical protein
MIKLYKRSEDQIHYWEAWEDGNKIVFHWGVLGERGETRKVRVDRWKSAERIIAKEAKKRQFEGYHEISVDAHKSLIVQYRTEGWGSPQDLEKRYAIEDWLNECLGWTGNGHCTGGDIGSGTINIFSYVIDPYIARDEVVGALRKAKLIRGATIALESEDGFEVLWPEDFDGEFAYWYET